MCPHVIYDDTARLFRMWYSGGEQGEPNAIGYANSSDGVTWNKHASNPVFKPDMKAIVREEVKSLQNDVGKAAGGLLDGLLGGKKKN